MVAIPHGPPRGEPIPPAPIAVLLGDGVWTLALAAPLVLCFVPSLDKTAADAMATLGHAPLWYQEAVGAAIVFAFGHRTMWGLRALPRLPNRPPPIPPAPGTPAKGTTQGNPLG